jgi:NADH dehydrogenase [ubiquinone] 1 alpha subcomplex assembly factor 7
VAGGHIFLLVRVQAAGGNVNALAARIAQTIAAEGPLSVAQFMTMAALDPQHGYYTTRDPVGAGGDFVTAPEISQVFGELVGLWCVQAWLDQGRPPHARLVELGPGTGSLMDDALRAAKLAPEFRQAVDVVMVDANPALVARQKERLADVGVSIAWRVQFDESLSDRPLFLIANEFFDALAIRQFVKASRGWCENMVTVDADMNLALALSPDPLPLHVPAERGDAPDGAVYETSPASTALAEELGRAIATHGGAALIVDYGYSGMGFGDTLQAVGKHRFKDVLATPGEIDLSAHVDFDALACAAERGGAASYGPVAQGELLAGLGILDRMMALRRQNPGGQAEIATAVDRLINPAQMGTLFKALAILPKGAPKPPGF